MPTTRFPSRAAGPVERISDFIAHLRMNGYPTGPADVSIAISAFGMIDATNSDQARHALRAILVPDHDSWTGFDALFDAYWFNAGREASGSARKDHVRTQTSRPRLWQPHLDGTTKDGTGASDDLAPDAGEGDAEGMDGRLVATRTVNLTRRDLRELVDDEGLRAAERAATKLARALVDRRSRRYRADPRGRRLDLRRVLRASLARGGEPLDLFHRKPPTRPLRLVTLCDVSGSMTVYARVYLAFVKGLMSASTRMDAYLFHTRLMQVTRALRDHDTLRAAGRLSLMAEGFGGGTDIAGCLATFNAQYAARAVNGRTVVVILSDGYCTSEPQALSASLARLRRRAGRIIWLNPLLGWRDYTPVANSISAALPHIDAHLPANTVEALAALEPEFRRVSR